MLTIVEIDSSTWIVIATGGELRIYSRDQTEEWRELLLSDDAEEVEEEKALMLEVRGGSGAPTRSARAAPPERGARARGGWRAARRE